jgi:hypothetical protein
MTGDAISRPSQSQTQHPTPRHAGAATGDGAGNGRSHGGLSVAHAFLLRALKMGPLNTDTRVDMYAAVVCDAMAELGHADHGGHAALLAEALGPLAAALEARHGSSMRGGGGTPPAMPWLQLPLDLWAEGQAEGSSSSPAGKGGAGGERMPQAEAAAGGLLVAATQRVVLSCLTACGDAADAWAEDNVGMGQLVERLGQLIWHCLRHPGALTDEDEGCLHWQEVGLRSS